MRPGVRDLAPKPDRSISNASSVPTPSPAPPAPPAPPGFPPPPPPMSRKRGVITAIACVSCRRKKRKCNGARPTCDACGALKLQCAYEISPNERFQSDLRQKVRELERQLADLKTTLGPLATEASEDRNAVIRTAQEIHHQHKHQRNQSNLLELGNLPEGLATASMGIHGGGLGVPRSVASFAPSSSAGMIESTSQVGSPMSIPAMRHSSPSLGNNPFSILSSMSGLTSMTSDPLAQVRSQDGSSAEWMTDSGNQDYPMFFGIEDQLDNFPNTQTLPQQQQIPLSFVPQSVPKQLRAYRHEAARLGEYIEYIGGPNGPSNSSTTTNTTGSVPLYASTTPNPQAYRLVKVPTYTLQPADTEEFPPTELDATRHLSHEWVRFRDKCRNMIAQGHVTTDEVLGTNTHLLPPSHSGLVDGELPEHADDVDVDMAMLFNPPSLSSAVTIFGWCAALVARAERIRTLPMSLRVATVYLAVLLLRWQVSPTKTNYLALPEWLRPIPSQIFDGHCAVIDLVPWPLVREGLCRNPQDFVQVITLYTSFDWFWADLDCLTSDSSINSGSNHPHKQPSHDVNTALYAAAQARIQGSGGKRRTTESTASGGLRLHHGGGDQTRVSPLFKTHVRDLRHWVLDAAVLQRFPEWEGRAYIRQAGPSENTTGPGGGLRVA